MPIRLFALARKNPVERMISSTSSGLAPGQRRRIRVGREEGGRHHVDPDVGALGRQDGGRQELERVVRSPGRTAPWPCPGYSSARRSTVRRARPFGCPGASPPVHGTGLRWPQWTLLDIETACRPRRWPRRRRAATPSARPGAGRASGRRPPAAGRTAAAAAPARRDAARRAPRAGPRRGGLVGCAFITPALDGATALHVAVDPAAGATEAAVKTALMRRAVHEAPGAGARAPLGSCRPRPPTTPRPHDPASCPSATCSRCASPSPCPRRRGGDPPVATRPFEPGRDDAAWLAINNRAFAGHPEQGGWTLDDLHEHMAADWVDLDGFLVADDPDGNGPHRLVLDQDPPRPPPGPGRDLRDLRRPPAPRPGLGAVAHRGRAGVDWPAAASPSACSTPTPPTRPR